MTNAVNMSIVNTVWKWRTANQYPVLVKDVTNLVNSNAYPAMVTFETVKGAKLTLPYSLFATSLERTDASLMKFVAMRKTIADFV